jgi:hypothetical protein
VATTPVSDRLRAGNNKIIDISASEIIWKDTATITYGRRKLYLTRL